MTTGRLSQNLETSSPSNTENNTNQKAALWFACVLSRVLLCDPTDCSPPGSSGEWTAISRSRGSSRPRRWTCNSWAPALADILYHLSDLESLISTFKKKTYPSGYEPNCKYPDSRIRFKSQLLHLLQDVVWGKLLHISLPLFPTLSHRKARVVITQVIKITWTWSCNKELSTTTGTK